MTHSHNKPDLSIGFIGMGLMGIPMSRRLLHAGYKVCVWNRNTIKTSALAAAGATAAGSIKELVSLSDVVMICVSNTAAVESVVFGDGGIAEFSNSDKLLVDFSSIAPDATRRMAAQLKAQTGMEWIDAPVSGGVAGAEAGTLAIMVGGASEHIDKVRPLLAHLSQRVTRMGPVGSGQATKICNQMIVSCNVMVIAEVLALAEKAGVDATQVPEALKGGFADSIPLQLTGTRMAARDFDEIKWHVKTLLKDLGMAEDLAKSVDALTPMAQLGKTLMKDHSDAGYTNKDPATLINMYSE